MGRLLFNNLQDTTGISSVYQISLAHKTMPPNLAFVLGLFSLQIISHSLLPSIPPGDRLPPLGYPLITSKKELTLFCTHL